MADVLTSRGPRGITMAEAGPSGRTGRPFDWPKHRCLRFGIGEADEVNGESEMSTSPPSRCGDPEGQVDGQRPPFRDTELLSCSVQLPGHGSQGTEPTRRWSECACPYASEFEPETCGLRVRGRGVRAVRLRPLTCYSVFAWSIELGVSRPNIAEIVGWIVGRNPAPPGSHLARRVLCSSDRTWLIDRSSSTQHAPPLSRKERYRR